MAQGTPTEQQAQQPNQLSNLINAPGIKEAGVTAGLGLLFGLRPEEAIQAGAAVGLQAKGQDQNLQALLLKKKEDVRERSQKISQDLRKEFTGNDVIKDFAKISSAVSRMNTVWGDFQNRPNEASRNALDQTLVITFNKMLDPGSVVRESEYARTPQGLSLVRRMGALSEKLAKGGAGLDDEERSEIVRAAKLLAQGQQLEAQKIQTFYRDEATRSGVDPIRVVIPIDEIEIEDTSSFSIDKSDADLLPEEEIIGGQKFRKVRDANGKVIGRRLVGRGTGKGQ